MSYRGQVFIQETRVGSVGYTETIFSISKLGQVRAKFGLNPGQLGSLQSVRYDQYDAIGIKLGHAGIKLGVAGAR